MKNNITAGTIARTIVLILALANQVLAMCGKQVLNIADDDIYQVIILKKGHKFIGHNHQAIG